MICRKCKDRGWYGYDDNHAKICEDCCVHSLPRWLISEGQSGYRDGHDTWCCGNGCGTTFTEEFNGDVIEIEDRPVYKGD